jgi:N-methylhydantoinase A
MVEYRVGVDIGGTFTDIVFLGRDGTMLTKKIASSVDNFARAVTSGIAEVLQEQRLDASEIKEVLHGTTVASNAILEHKGAKTGLIATKGFRDVLELGHLRMPRLYDMGWQKPPPLVERYLRLTVDERMSARGQVIRLLNLAEVQRVVERLLDEKVEAIAVCLLNSYANPAHELVIEEVLKRCAPRLTYCLSCEVLPEMREYERTSTVVINAYVMPVVARYLANLVNDFVDKGIRAPLLLIQSSGGLTTAASAMSRPMHIVESGPAGGVIGAQVLAKRFGLVNVITFDMGGTTAKASLVEKGEVARSPVYQVGGGIIMGSRLFTGGGYILRVPAIDIAEVGAGGGSIVWIDPAGSMQVGPHSAGAQPGPVCYAKGGTEPTITDANVILGYINPAHLVDGALKLDADLARAAFAERVARPLGLSLERAAFGAHQIVASNMIRAIKAVSTERGRDPRDCVLFAFGGNGPVFAGEMARALQMTRIVIPPLPGLFSSFGMLFADVEHHYSRTFRRLLNSIAPRELEEACERLTNEAVEQLHVEGFPRDRMVLRRSATMHYQGQSFELTIPIPEGHLDSAALTALGRAFGAEHERTYGHRGGPEEPVEIVNIQLSSLGLPDRPREPPQSRVASQTHPSQPSRRVYFGPAVGWLETPVRRRGEFGSAKLGPCIIEEYDATCVVPPNARASLDEAGSIVIELP